MGDRTRCEIATAGLAASKCSVAEERNESFGRCSMPLSFLFLVFRWFELQVPIWHGSRMLGMVQWRSCPAAATAPSSTWQLRRKLDVNNVLDDDLLKAADLLEVDDLHYQE